jgi:GT2 family glycosyltransferase
LNPDTILRENFLEEMVQGLESRPDCGSASGKLLRLDQITIDSTGIVMLRSQRHLDRGAGEPDIGQYDKALDIFGPSGAAALYRRSSLEDVSIDGEYFDEDFFAYREDADLAWRLRLLGWKSIYVPSAVALHRRRVTPERRSQLPGLINYHSVKNRFLLRINNMTCDLYRRDFWRITGRDAMVVGYVFLREWSSAPALAYVVRYLPRLWRKRRLIQSRIRITPDELSRWFN